MKLPGMTVRTGLRWRVLLIGLSALCLAVLLPPTPQSDALPNGFRDTAVISGLQLPTTVAFAPNGKVFVAEKS